ncbi:50S ribosomal protein L1 [Candidatus Parcubacteria bacterium]|nr:50S ribosomal protein L1 [Candidatus Parcubacteria bacterium]
MRSKHYKELKKQIDKTKVYPIVEAVDILKKMARKNFDESVEVHIRLGIDPKKGEQQVRGAVSLPHSTGKTRRIAAFTNSPEKAKQAGATLAGGQDLIDEIKKTEKTDFDVAVAEPAMMKSIAPIARILGTRGLMPSPKTGTVNPDIEAAVKELTGGKVNFKNDDSGNVHQLVGKVSLDKGKLFDNVKAFVEAIKKIKPAGVKGEYIKGITLCTTMGPGIKITA